MGKEVVEDVSGWLRVFSDGTVERKWNGENEQVLALTMPVPPSNDTFVEGVATKDVIVNEETGVWVRIYLPQTALQQHENQRLGMVIHLHGGGFCVSQPHWQMYYHFYARLVRASNVICVSVAFRLAPEHRLPAACEDSFGVLLWLRSVARGEIEEPWLTRYADFSRCILMGDSSGANLVHEVGLRSQSTPPDLLHPVCVRGGISLHPGYVRSERSQSEKETPSESALLTLDMVDKFLILSAPEGITTRNHAITNPMGPDAPPLKELKFPRMLVAIANRDLIRDTELEYCEAMKSAGHDVEVFYSQNVGHSFYLNEIAIRYDPKTAKETSKLLEVADRFIQSCV